jgi:hypothetical protein
MQPMSQLLPANPPVSRQPRHFSTPAQTPQHPLAHRYPDKLSIYSLLGANDCAPLSPTRPGQVIPSIVSGYRLYHVALGRVYRHVSWVAYPYLYTFDAMQAALAAHQLGLQESLPTLSESSTSQIHSARPHVQYPCLKRGRAVRNLSVAQEDVLHTKIDAYTDADILLTPRHIKGLARTVCGHDIGVNWATTFLCSLKGCISSKFGKV